MMMVLGRFVFSLNTAAFQTKSRKTQYRWSESDGLPHSQLSQYIGQDVDTLTLQGAIYPRFKGGLTQLDAIRREADKGQPLLLIQGNGQVLGEWLIVSIEENQRQFDSMGLPSCIEFSIELRAYNQDKLNLAKQLHKAFGV